jgi:predicted nuclease of restriction endonuclease-like RecB superfamily
MRRNQVAIKNGFRSGLEENINDLLKESNKIFGYETEKLPYIQPETKHKYTPDFVMIKRGGKKMYVETKGRWVKTDRLKFDLLFEQYPDIDIRFVFQNPNAKLYKGSKTTYAQYCDKKGWLWAKKEIPQEWLDECLDL